MSSRLLQDAGEAPYSSEWRARLTRALGISEREMRQLLAGEVELAPDLAAILWGLVLDRAETLANLGDRIRAVAGVVDES